MPSTPNHTTGIRDEDDLWFVPHTLWWRSSNSRFVTHSKAAPSHVQLAWPTADEKPRFIPMPHPIDHLQEDAGCLFSMLGGADREAVFS